MNDIINAMKERRSVRKFKPDMPSDEEIMQVVEAGLYAASGMNFQDSKIIVVTNKELRDQISQDNAAIMHAEEGADPLYGAPVVIIVLGDKSKATYLYNGSLVLGNMMLAAHSMGLGSCWIHRSKEEFEKDYYKDILKKLDIEGDYEGIGHLILGYPDETVTAPKEIKPDRVYWIG